MKATTSYKSSRGKDTKQGCGSLSCWEDVTLLILLYLDDDDDGACILYDIIDDDTSTALDALRLQAIASIVEILYACEGINTALIKLWWRQLLPLQ